MPFRKPRKARKRRGWGFSPIMVALPLAAFTAVFMWGGGPPGWARVSGPAPAPTAQDPEAANFGQCYGRQGQNCVIDGDSLRYQGRQIRIADIDAPELGIDLSEQFPNRVRVRNVSVRGNRLPAQ